MHRWLVISILASVMSLIAGPVAAQDEPVGEQPAAEGEGEGAPADEGSDDQGDDEQDAATGTTEPADEGTQGGGESSDAPTSLIPEGTPDSKKVQGDKLKREGQEAQEARKAAMKALAAKHPGQEGGFEPVAAPAPPPTPREAAEVLPRLEHHGYFRFRADLFNNLDLNTRGTSPVPPPLDSKERGRDAQPNIKPTDADTLAGANIRFRYAPTFHITEDLRVYTTLELLDNLVLGSTPDAMRAVRTDIPVLAFTGGTEEPRLDTVGKDSIVVRAAFAEVKTLFGVLRAGRMPSDWGLGILANGGGSFSATRQALGDPAWSCIDCNHGDFVDRIMFLTKEPIYRSVYIVFAWDFVSEGLVGYNLDSDVYGQAFDLSQADDVTQFVLAVFQRPMVKQEIDERNRDFHDRRKPVFDWGAYFVYRSQEADASGRATSSSAYGRGNASDVTLEPRNITAYIPDLWARFMYKFGYKQTLRLEAEATGIFGEIGQTTADPDSWRDLQQLGLAIEAEARIYDGLVGLNTGFASGKDSIGWGYLDILATEDPRAGVVARDIDNFRFDRNYYIDLIMFRELVGGITNAVYFDAWGAYHFPIETAQAFDTFGARLDVITAFAPKPDSTPGGEAWYGLETDLKVFYEESDRYRAEIAGGFFVPGPVWTRKADGSYPIRPADSVYADDRTIDEDLEGELAWTLQANLWWLF